MRFSGLFILCFLFLIMPACQESVSTQTDNTTPDQLTSFEYKPDRYRTIVEEPISFPQGQNIQLIPRTQNRADSAPTLIFKGYDGTSFLFDQVDATGKPIDSLWTMHFHWDNREAVPVRSRNIQFSLPERDHILCAYLVDAEGLAIRENSALVGKMIRIKDGEIIKMDDSGILQYYISPRHTYTSGKPVPLDFFILNEEPAAALSIEVKIDGQSFWMETSGSHDILGLKPGKHMVELILYRSGDVYNVPLNPARMTFEVVE